jgi:hypothetical protein
MLIQRDAIIEGRLDSRDLATCAEYLLGKGCSINSNSELMYLITQLAIFAIGETKERTTQEAREYLASIGLTNMNRSGKGKRTLQRVLQTENLTADGFDASYLQHKTKATMQMSTEDFERLVRQAVKTSDADSTIDALKDTVDAIAQSKNIMLDKKDE